MQTFCCDDGKQRARAMAFVILLGLSLVVVAWTMLSTRANAADLPPASSRSTGAEQVKDGLREHGIDLQLWLTHFSQGLVAGDGDKTWQHGAKADLIVTLDGESAGLWRGFSLNLHPQFQFGDDANLIGAGPLIPVNTGLAFPRLGGRDYDISFVANQRFNEAFSVSIGKFNLFDAAAEVPLIGGGGLDTFFNHAIAAPISGLDPPYVVGALFELETALAVFNLFIYDPRNAQDWDVVARPFTEGVTFNLSATIPSTMAGLSGFHTFRGIYSTKDENDPQEDLPQLVLPAALPDSPRPQSGSWFASYAVQQFLVQSESDHELGWGIFGEVGVSDGDPNELQWHYLVGLGGNNLIADRPNDRWGIAYFHYSLSDYLRDEASSALGISLEEESGFEAFYNAELTDWFRLTGNLQIIDPFPLQSNRAVYLGMRGQFRL